MVDIADIPMKQIKSSVLEQMEPGKAVDPLKLISQLHESTGISSYDLKAAIWYLIGDRRIHLDNHLDVVRTDETNSP